MSITEVEVVESVVLPSNLGVIQEVNNASLVLSLVHAERSKCQVCSLANETFA